MLAANVGGPHGNRNWLRKTTAAEERAHSFIVHSPLELINKKQTFIENLRFARFSALEHT